MLRLFDTDHLSLLERGGLEGITIAKRLLSLGPDDYGISVITYAEQTKGWLAEVARARTPDEEVRAFAQLLRGFRGCQNFAIWGYTPEAAEQCATLRRLKIRIGTQDMRIASIALVNDAMLLTRNTSDFERVPGLRIEDWSR